MASILKGGVVRSPSDAVEGEPAPALARALEGWDKLVEALPVAMYVCDADGYLVRYNRRAEELWGRTPQIGEERYCGSLRMFRPNGAWLAHVDCPLADVLRTGTPVRGKEVVIERPDGSRITALVSIDPLIDEDGTVAGAFNCFQDISGRKQAEAALAASERRYRNLLDALPAAIYTTDAAGRITFYNEAAAQLAGQRPRLGTDEWCITWRMYRSDGSPLPHDQCPMAIALKEDRPVRGTEAVCERPDGTRVPLLPFPTPLHDEGGALIGAVNMLVDVSERKAAEANQRILLDELNHRVKNNMQMLHALLTSARRGAATDEARTALDDAARRVAAMAAAQRALYASGADTFAASEFLDAVASAARQGLAGRFRVEIAPTQAELSNEMAMPLSLILNELLTNAVRHGVRQAGSDRGATIRIGLDHDDGGFALQVADEGPGFDFHERLPARNSTSGLNLVHGLARQLGGDLSVERRHPGALCIVKFPQTRPIRR